MIPLLLQTALGQRGSFKVYGDRWPTPDGTCVRDFVSVRDLATAHLAALLRLEPGRMERYNLGSGRGTSVRELLDAASRLAGRPVPHTIEPPRPGDPAVLVADISRAAEGLDWRPAHSSIEEIFASAWRWHGGRGAAFYPDAEAGPRRASA